MNGLNKIHSGSALEVLKRMPDNFVDCVVTSPPYWSLRCYQTEPQIWDMNKKCEHEWYRIDAIRKTSPGDRPSSKSLIAIRRTVNENRPGKPSDFCKKCSAWRGELGLEPTFNLYLDHLLLIFAEVKRVMKPTGTLWVNLGDTYSGSEKGILQKSLCGIPERFAIRMTDELGFIRRNTIIWWKRNAMPVSVKDRFTVDFEPIYFFTKSRRYYFQQQFEPHQWADRDKRSQRDWSENKAKSGKMVEQRYSMGQVSYGKNGRNMRCVWDIPTSGFSDAHFATFPEDLLIPMIKSGCPEGGIVLDPFSGAGTSCLVAKKLNRNYIGIELNPEYVRMSERRIEQECGILV